MRRHKLTKSFSPNIAASAGRRSRGGVPAAGLHLHVTTACCESVPRRTRALESERQGPLGDCPRDCRGDSSKKPPLTQTHALGAAGPLVERRGHPPGQLAAGGIKRTRGGGKIMARVATPRTDKRGCRSSPALPRQNRGTRWADSRRCIQRRPARDQGRHVFAPVACPVRSGRPAILRLLSLDTFRFRRVQSIQDDMLY